MASVQTNSENFTRSSFIMSGMRLQCTRQHVLIENADAENADSCRADFLLANLGVTR